MCRIKICIERRGKIVILIVVLGDKVKLKQKKITQQTFFYVNSEIIFIKENSVLIFNCCFFFLNIKTKMTAKKINRMEPNFCY